MTARFAAVILLALVATACEQENQTPVARNQSIQDDQATPASSKIPGDRDVNNNTNSGRGAK